MYARRALSIPSLASSHAQQNATVAGNAGQRLPRRSFFPWVLPSMLLEIYSSLTVGTPESGRCRPAAMESEVFPATAGQRSRHRWHFDGGRPGRLAHRL